MPYRDREDKLGASEDNFYPYPGLSSLSHILGVDYWCQNVPFGQYLPPTPPDTASDCTIPDSPDMDSTPGIGTFADDGWYNELAPDNSTCAQSFNSDWTQSYVVCSMPDFEPQDTQAWTNPIQGSVDLGLSPALSYESQSSRTLNTFADDEPLLHTARFDLPLEPANGWTARGVDIHGPHHVAQQPLISEDSMYLPGTAPSDATYYSFGKHDPNPPFWNPSTLSTSRMAAYPQIAPRTSTVPASTGNSSKIGSAGPSLVQSPAKDTHASVSSPAYMPAAVSASASGIFPANLNVAYTGDLHQESVSAFDSRFGQTRPSGVMPTVVDPTTDDFQAFIDYPLEEQILGHGLVKSEPFAHVPVSAASQWQGYQASERHPDDLPRPSMLSSPAAHRPVPKASKTSVAISVTSDLDEGRHRTHPLYNKGPDADGLYRCPFRPKENCPHEPNKLKCNYEYDTSIAYPSSSFYASAALQRHTDISFLICSKFIDSHLKPFRCKNEECTKQAFSSTACLLRHEREAHGMHGHGDRPHHCLYTGCERANPRNGFPRLYNLRDHMKRVHDWKEPVAETASHVTGPKRGGGRKRKAAATEPPQPQAASRRSRTGADHTALPREQLRTSMGSVRPKISEEDFAHGVTYPKRTGPGVRYRHGS